MAVSQYLSITRSCSTLSKLIRLGFETRHQLHSQPHDYADAVLVVRAILQNRGLLAPAHGGVLNVNIPDVPLLQMRGFKVCRLGRRLYDKHFTENIDPRGRPYFWLGGGGDEFADIPESDCKLLYENYVTLTVLSPDRVHDAANEALKKSATTEFSKRLGVDIC